MTGDADDGEQELACGHVGMFIVEDILKLEVEHGVRQMVRTQESVVVGIGRRLQFLYGLIPYLPLLIGKIQEKLILTFLLLG